VRPIVRLVAKRRRMFEVFDADRQRTVYLSDSYDDCLAMMERIEAMEAAALKPPPTPIEPPRGRRPRKLITHIAVSDLMDEGVPA
jgi:hypothetical protein